MPNEASPLLASPAIHLWGVVTILLVLKMIAVGFYTSALRIRRSVYATPEDYAVRNLAPGGARDDDVERVRRAHLNDLENVLPFMVVSLVYVLTGPSEIAATIFLVGFLVARTLHSVFYIRGLQPHRTIAFTVATGLMLVMMVTALVRLLT